MGRTGLTIVGFDGRKGPKAEEFRPSLEAGKGKDGILP